MIHSDKLFHCHFQKNNTTDKVVFKGVDYIPTWVSVDDTENAKKNFRVLPVGKYLTSPTLLATLSEDAKKRIEEVWNEITTVIGSQLIPAINE